VPLQVTRRLDQSRLKVAATCLAAGILLAASLPPWGWWPLAFAGIILVDRVLDGVAVKGRFLRGALIGFALLGPTMAWLKELTFPGYLIAVGLYSVALGVFLMAVPPGGGRRLALPGAWVLLEAFRGSWPFGGVPLSVLSTGQIAGPLAGLARVGGTLLIAAVTVGVGIGLAAAIRRQLLPATIGLLAAITFVGLATLAPQGGDTGRRIDIAYVQGGGPQGTRAIDTDMRKVFLRHLDASASLPTGLDLVLWPEDVVDTDGPVQDFREGDELKALARRLHTTLIVGTVETVSDTKFRNSAKVFTAEGKLTDTYEKVHRVPFGEWVPFRSLLTPLLTPLAGDSLPEHDAIVGHKPAVLHTPAANVAVVISWEVFFGDRARDGVNHGGQLLINPTNGSSFTRTLVQSQQIAFSRLRAIETGRWEVQVAPTGFSAFVTPGGRVLQRSPVAKRTVEIRRGVPLRGGRTIYVRFGDRPILLMASLAVVGGWLVARRSREPATASRQSDDAAPPEAADADVDSTRQPEGAVLTAPPPPRA